MLETIRVESRVEKSNPSRIVGCDAIGGATKLCCVSLRNDVAAVSGNFLGVSGAVRDTATVTSMAVGRVGGHPGVQQPECPKKDRRYGRRRARDKMGKSKTCNTSRSNTQEVASQRTTAAALLHIHGTTRASQQRFRCFCAKGLPRGRFRRE